MTYMHDSMLRLYQAAKQIKKIAGQSAVAALLSESPQTVNNWETRGVSTNGALKAQTKIGCNAHWLLTGAGSMFAVWPFPKVPIERFLDLDDDDRGYVQIKLLQAIAECEEIEATEATEADHAVLDKNVRTTNKTFRAKEPKKSA
jgi:hypothetical protein